MAQNHAASALEVRLLSLAPLAPVAHLAERPPRKREAVGATPTWGSTPSVAFGEGSELVPRPGGSTPTLGSNVAIG